MSIGGETGRRTRIPARCVLWSRGTPPPALISAVRRRNVEPVVTHDAFRTMAELVAEGSIEGPTAILVLVEPSRLRGKKAMLGACRRYAPALRVWVFQSAAPVQLRPVELALLVPEPTEEPADRTTGSAGDTLIVPAIPALRLAGETQGPVQPRSASADNSGEYPSSGLLSEEELAMLLADDHPEDRRGRRE
jgi:hypothetical protein